MGSLGHGLQMRQHIIDGNACDLLDIAAFLSQGNKEAGSQHIAAFGSTANQRLGAYHMAT